MTEFPPTRDAAIARLNAFLPHAGFEYARQRNYDTPGHSEVSRLSPYIRHRLITEEEVLKATLSIHTAKEAEKFIAEVCWRTYWKGVLELRPAMWTQYQMELHRAWNDVQTNSGLRQSWEAACNGDTGIDCFDHWAQELANTGYLHNHARMWFASIWIFTLRLPWVLGADFFLRHLLDGDPASNTLSWRWVGGLQTKGKTYLARADNIAKYTQGRFNPKGLATYAAPLDGAELPDRGPAPQSDARPNSGKIGLLITDEDLSPDWLMDGVETIATFAPQTAFGPLKTAPKVSEFKSNCMSDLEKRLKIQSQRIDNVDGIKDWAKSNALNHVLLAAAPVGPTQNALTDLRHELKAEGVNLSVQVRAFDATAWPRATHGFFRFKNTIPELLSGLT